MKKLLIATPLIVLAPLLGLGACASASATSKASEPALVIPPPPPHVVRITPEPVVLDPVADIPAATTAGTAPRTGRGVRDTPPRQTATDAKPDPKPGAEATPPPVDPVPSPAPATPPGPTPQLRIAESPGTEGTVRATIDRTRQILGTVDYRQLNPVLKKAYDDAKKFADQADDALKQGNVVFAQGVAGKAETLAKELARR
jgi:hypothetical protein